MKYIHYVWFVTTHTGNEDFFIDWESDDKTPKFSDMTDKIVEVLRGKNLGEQSTVNVKFGVKNVTTVLND